MSNVTLKELDKISVDLQSKISYIYPELEDLSITPTEDVQVLDHPNSYGYNRVTVAKGVFPPVIENNKMVYSSGASVSGGTLKL